MVTVAIKITRKQKKILDRMREHPRETYADILDRILTNQDKGEKG